MSETLSSNSVRAFLAQTTRAAHDALHRDPLFSRLLASDLSVREYQACLGVNLAFFERIESARVMDNLQPDLTLLDAISALRRDLDAGRDVAGHHLRDPCALTDPHAVLGALYVAHGSQFGRQVMAVAVKTSLPQVSRHYFRMRSNATLWRRLLARLEGCSSDAAALARLTSGAAHAFRLFGSLASEAHSSLGAPVRPRLSGQRI